MKLFENPIHGRQCKSCGKVLLYGAKIYTDGKDVYCYKCGKSPVLCETCKHDYYCPVQPKKCIICDNYKRDTVIVG
jgi:hypothetical protein